MQGSFAAIITGYLNIRSGALVTSQGGSFPLGGRESCAGLPGDDALRICAGDKVLLRVLPFDPWNDDDTVLLDDADELVFALKPWDDHNTGMPLARVATEDWDWPGDLNDNAQTDLTDNPGGWLLATLDLGTDVLDELLPAGTNSLYAHGQIQLTRAENGRTHSSHWIPTVVSSDIVRPTDESPTLTASPSPSPASWYPGIEALTGGGAAALDGIKTAGRSGLMAILYVTEFQHWLLFEGTDAEDANAGVIRPDDYHASTNAQVWRRRL